mmetsp:Transcript_7925/g.27145  ORF Transcript_7925/g.27145 Transcript_7925/m.27145 type:complete len:335 (-) Transcript_7925:967-1971(-)
MDRSRFMTLKVVSLARRASAGCCAATWDWSASSCRVSALSLRDASSGSLASSTPGARSCCAAANSWKRLRSSSRISSRSCFVPPTTPALRSSAYCFRSPRRLSTACWRTASSSIPGRFFSMERSCFMAAYDVRRLSRVGARGRATSARSDSSSARMDAMASSWVRAASSSAGCERGDERISAASWRSSALISSFSAVETAPTKPLRRSSAYFWNLGRRRGVRSKTGERTAPETRWSFMASTCLRTTPESECRRLLRECRVESSELSDASLRSGDADGDASETRRFRFSSSRPRFMALKELRRCCRACAGGARNSADSASSFAWTAIRALWSAAP